MPELAEALRTNLRLTAMELRELNCLYPAGDPKHTPGTTADDFPLQAITALHNYFQTEPTAQDPRYREFLQSLSEFKAAWLDLNPDHTPDSVTPSTTSGTTPNSLDISPDQRVIVYTDGSCLGNPGPGGYAAVIVVNDIKIAEVAGNSPASTNNRMELQAVISALQFLIPQLPGENPLCVVTDSKYVSDAHRQGWIANWRSNGWRTAKHGPVANQDLWIALTDLEESVPQIEYLWIKGHANDTYNNEADRLAVQQAGYLTRKYIS